MDKTILKRFRDYELTHGRVYIDSCETIDGDDMVPGLRSILRAMADYQGVEGQVVDLTHKWGWAASWPWARELPGELCAVVSECVPLLTHLKIGVSESGHVHTHTHTQRHKLPPPLRFTEGGYLPL